MQSNALPEMVPGASQTQSSGARTFARYWLKPIVFVLCLVPLALFVSDILHGVYANKPPRYITNYSGDVAMRFLVLSLAVTPIRLVSMSNEIARLRRMLGLFAFTYTVLHCAAYFALDLKSDASLIIPDLRRFFIIVGWAAVMIFIPLAATSTNAMVRLLGGENWRRLHRLVYLAAVLAVVHTYLVDVASHRTIGVVYGLIFLVLLGIRAAYRAAVQTTAAKRTA